MKTILTILLCFLASYPAWGAARVRVSPVPANLAGVHVTNPPGAVSAMGAGALRLQPLSNPLHFERGAALLQPILFPAIRAQLAQIQAQPVAALERLRASAEPGAVALYRVLAHPEAIAEQGAALSVLTGPGNFQALAATVGELHKLAGQDGAVRALLSSGEPFAAMEESKEMFDGAAAPRHGIRGGPPEKPVVAAPAAGGRKIKSSGLEKSRGRAFAPQPIAGSPFRYIDKDGKRFLQLQSGEHARLMELGSGGPRAPRVRFLRRDVLEVSVGERPFLVKLTPDNLDYLATMMEYLSDPDATLTNLMLRGDMGTGKNTLVYTLAGLLNQGVRIMSFHAHSNEKDLRYRTTLGEGKAGETSRKHSDLYEGAEAGDWVILDEPNKPLQIGILNSLNTILQNRRETLPGEDRPVTAHPRFRAISLINPPNRSYTVTEMPADFIRRFSVLDVDYMKPADEVDFVMDTVFLDETDRMKEQLKPLIEQLVGLANDLRSSYRQGHLPRPMSTRGVLSMAWHIKKFPKDFPYFREIFDPVYPTEYLERNEIALVEEYLKQHNLQGQDRPADFKLPDVEFDEKAGKVRLGDTQWGVVELPLGDLKAEEIPESYRDMPHLQANLRLWWALMKDRALGRHSLVLGETGTGKTQLTGHLLYALLRIRPEEQTFTRQTRGQDIVGKPELKDDATYWPPYPLQRAVDRNTFWLVDEVTKPEDPGTVSLLNNVLQFGQILLPSGKVLNAGRGFGVLAMGTPARAQYEAQEFSGEVLDRFSTHILKPLPAAEEIGLVASYAGQRGLDIKMPILEALQKALDSLRKAYRQGLLPVPPSVQSLFRVISRLGRFPDTKNDIVRTFLRAFPAWERSHEDIIRRAMAPVVQAQQAAASAWAPVSAGGPADTMNGIMGEFVAIAPGEFEMGSLLNEEGRHGDEASHPVRLTQGFELQRVPVTQRQYAMVMGVNPSRFKEEKYSDNDYMVLNGQAMNADHPVETVSWEDAQEFIKRLNESQTEYMYRLPTEAEWEYAARAGTKSPYWFPIWFGAGETDARTWHSGNSGWRTHAVNRAEHANPWGLLDMLGNVLEWVQDFYGRYQNPGDEGVVTDPQGSPGGSGHVLRGGAWSADSKELRSATRRSAAADSRRDDVGFRLARSRR